MNEIQGPLSKEQVTQWQERGYVVVSGLLEPALVESCKQIMLDTFKDSDSRDFGSDGRCEFPTCNGLDDVTTHENLIDAVSQLLETPDILLAQRYSISLL